MEVDDRLYEAYLAEMEALERFRITYTGVHRGAPLEREDQDVRRMIEALAVFSARARLAGQRSLFRTSLRLFRQHFPYILSPVPAMSMLRAVQTPSFVDAATIPRGTEVSVAVPEGTTRSGGVATRAHLFRTMIGMRLLPIELASIDIFRRGTTGLRLILRFVSAFPRNDEIDTVALYVNHLNDFAASLAVRHALEQNLEGASVFFGETPGEDSVGAPVELRFGAPAVEGDEAEAFDHPLQRIRSFLMFPQQELYVHATFPSPPRNWRDFTLCLDLGRRWPTQMRLGIETFQLHVVPMMNVRRELAYPVEVDGTKDRYSIRHPEDAAKFRVHSVVGAYRLDGDALVPLRPGFIEGEDGTFEWEAEGAGEARRAYLIPYLPRSFEAPTGVVADAYWHQPGLALDTLAGNRTYLSSRHLEGVRWECVAALSRSRENPIAEDHEQLLRLLSIKSQRFLGLGEILFVLEALGVSASPHFGGLPSHMSEVTVESKPLSRAASGFKYIYRVVFKDLEGGMVPALDLFCAKLLEVLVTWSVEEVVELQVLVPNLEIVRVLTGGDR